MRTAAAWALASALHLTPALRCSLRTLSRALEYARAAMPIYGVQRALLDGLSMVRLLAALACCAAAPRILHQTRNLVWAIQKFGMRGSRGRFGLRATLAPRLLTVLARRLS